MESYEKYKVRYFSNLPFYGIFIDYDQLPPISLIYHHDNRLSPSDNLVNSAEYYS